MNQKTVRKGCGIALAVYVALAILLFWIGGDQFHYRDEQTDMLTAGTPIGEITKDEVVTQKISVSGDELRGISFMGATYGRQNTGTLLIEVLEDGQLLGSASVDVSALQDNSEFSVSFSPAFSVPSGEAELRITAPESEPGNAITLYKGNTMSATRAEVSVAIAEEDLVSVNGTPLAGSLCMSVQSREFLWFGQYYGVFAGVFFVVLLLICTWVLHQNKRGRPSRILHVFAAFFRYRFLIKQLVARDFKTKYKRSVLGVLWSFLNPLLTMAVQYVVFSTLFKSDIPNFPVYLLTGIICFNFFSEAASMSLTSIVGNASLITKVYVPKYIYPLTRVMSSTINFLLSLIPLFLVLLVTQTPVRISVLLLPFGLVCLFAFSLGIGMLLASAMVFFRDMQFLWGVLSMIWMYLTPVFYPESIIPAQFMTVYKMNPLYQIIRFFRIALMDGVSPEPKAYLLMLLASFIPLLIGALVFKKTQDRFVLNL